MMNAGLGKRYMPSSRPLHRVYMLGGVDPANTHPKPADSTKGSIDIVRLHCTTSGNASGQTVLTSNTAPGIGGSGFQELVAGRISQGLDAWGGLSPRPAANSSDCVGFKATDRCSPSGPRLPAHDIGCADTVPCRSGECPSGYCLCKGGLKKHPVDCKPASHGPFTCA
jgi:hypothetical protein